MTLPKQMTVDGNEAAASIACRINEVAAMVMVLMGSGVETARQMSRDRRRTRGQEVRIEIEVRP